MSKYFVVVTENGDRLTTSYSPWLAVLLGGVGLAMLAGACIGLYLKMPKVPAVFLIIAGIGVALGTTTIPFTRAAASPEGITLVNGLLGTSVRTPVKMDGLSRVTLDRRVGRKKSGKGRRRYTYCHFHYDNGSLVVFRYRTPFRGLAAEHFLSLSRARGVTIEDRREPEER